MSRPTSFLSYFVVSLSVVLLAGCTVEGPESGTFSCESAEDCTEGQVCAKNKEGEKVCMDEVPDDCIDRDGDGYGSDERPLDNCPACIEERPNGCDPDCDDGDDRRHPGHPELCDGIDNDCDGETDEPAGTGEQACGNSDPDLVSCPLADFSGAEPPSDGTRFGCRTVDGTAQCAVVGSFSDSDACNNVDRRTFGTCEDEDWTDVPCECRTGESDCGGGDAGN